MENDEKQVCVLLVEDDPGDQKLIKTALLNQGYGIDLAMASSGEAAMDYLKKARQGIAEHTMPSLILLDLNMPGMGGKEFLRQVKADEQLSCIPVIVVTTSDSESDIRDCYALHAAGYIQKSAMPEEFKDVLKRLTRYWFSASELVKG